MDAATYSGRYSDGQTAATRPVQVTLAATAVEIALVDKSEPERWTYTKLRAAAPVSWRDNEVLLRSIEAPGATLFVPDPGFASAVLKHSPRLSVSAHRWRYAAPGLAITAAIILGITAIYALQLHPAQAVANVIPHALREAIGRKAMAELTGDHRECTSAEGTKALDTLVGELSTASESGKLFSVRVVNWDLVNAFAVPGEQIVISGGLIEAAQSADEVAGVLAHEMGHGIELHPEAGIIRSMGVSALIQLLAGGNTGSLTNVGALLLELRYSREAEHEADTHALRILKNADISPKPFGDFFKRLMKIESGGSSKSDSSGKAQSSADTAIFSTHPPTPERAKMAADAATYPGEPSLSDTDWKALKAICE